ncbi:stage III sporulation protein AF [Paenibacillus sp. GYB003]|uniref:stage III sporulation protein AF n=1 Tax=Paenibacillus sp. GYB003 TaxID=2994392 RepID=UPI002F96D99F
MMAWLSGWLKEIVVVVLLAAFVELLLPNNAYQRYVRTVLGLFILLALLSPLLSLFKQKWDAQKIVASVEQLGDAADSRTFAAMKPLQAIMQDAERWRQNDRGEAQRLMESELAAELQRSFGNDAGVRVKQVKLQLSYDNNGTPSMKHMQVILDHIQRPDSSPSEAEAPQRKPIAAVEPVHIDIRVGGTEPKTKPDESKLTKQQIDAKERMYEQVWRQWQLGRDEVTLLYESELEKAR